MGFCATTYEWQNWVFFLLIVVGFVVVLVANKFTTMANKSKLAHAVTDLNYTCLLKIRNPAVKKFLASLGRGRNYFWDKDSVETPMSAESIKDLNEHCVLTLWGLTHVLFHFSIGLFCPSYWIVSVLISVGFEVFEKAVWDCQDGFDVVLNTIGLCCGLLLRYFVFGCKNAERKWKNEHWGPR